MSLRQTPSAIKIPLEKKGSVTEDLHVDVSQESQNLENDIAKSTLDDIKESRGVLKLKADRDLTVNSHITNESSEKDARHSVEKTETQKTLAEVTLEMKNSLNKITEEINRSDIEFERVIGNVEKQIAQLRLKLGNK